MSKDISKDKQEFSKKYYPKLEKLFGFQNWLKLKEVDFERPWWYIIWQYKFGFGLIVLLESVLYIFMTVLPLIFAFILQSQRIEYIFYLAAFWLMVNLLPLFYIRLYCRLSGQVMQSVFYSANQFFLTADPIHHSTKSSGSIIAKTGRGADAYEDILDIFTYDILKVLVGLITTFVALAAIKGTLGYIVIFSLLIIVLVSSLIKYMASKITTPEWIAKDDARKNVSVENLGLQPYIRATFATPERNEKMRLASIESGVTQATTWMIHFSADTCTRILYVLSMFWVLLEIYQSVLGGSLDAATGLAAVLTYYSGSKDVWIIGNRIQRLTDRTERAKDLFEFIRNFGQQSFPVLEKSEKQISK